MAFLASFVPDIVDRFGFFSDTPSVTSALVCIVLHQNLLHLLANMVFLAAVGPAVEFATGAIRFLLIFLSGGICGVLLHWIATMNQVFPAPLIGASGGISACAAYYSIRYAHLRVPIVPNVSIPILGVVGLWLGLQALGAIVKIGDPTGGTAFWAHMGGFGCGIILSLAFRAPKLASVQFGHQVLERMNQRGPAATIAAAKQHLATHPSDVKALKELASAYEQIGDVTGELPVLNQLLSVANGQETKLSINRLASLGRLSDLPAIKRMRLAHDLESSDPELATQILQSVIDEPKETQRPDAILALIDLQNEPDANLLRQLVDSYPLHPATEIARSRGLIS
jgi:membrane associated rhomboid family serine protease